MTRVVLYGRLAEILGREIEISVEAPCTVAGLRARIAADHCDAAGPLADGRVRACVGNLVVGNDHPVGPSDEVDFLAPVSGG